MMKIESTKIFKVMRMRLQVAEGLLEAEEEQEAGVGVVEGAGKPQIPQKKRETRKTKSM